jgi:hypothetical protein
MKLADHASGDTAAAVPALLVAKRSSRLALKESQIYEPVAVCAMKIRGLRDVLGGCTAILQKQVKKHADLASYAKPLRKRAVAALGPRSVPAPARCLVVLMCDWPPHRRDGHRVRGSLCIRLSLSVYLFYAIVACLSLCKPSGASSCYD